MANKRANKYHLTINVKLNLKENAKVENLKHKYRVNSKELAIKRAIMEVSDGEN